MWVGGDIVKVEVKYSYTNPNGRLPLVDYHIVSDFDGPQENGVYKSFIEKETKRKDVKVLLKSEV